MESFRATLSRELEELRDARSTCLVDANVVAANDRSISPIQALGVVERRSKAHWIEIDDRNAKASIIDSVPALRSLPRLNLCCELDDVGSTPRSNALLPLRSGDGWGAAPLRRASRYHPVAQHLADVTSLIAFHTTSSRRTVRQRPDALDDFLSGYATTPCKYTYLPRSSRPSKREPSTVRLMDISPPGFDKRHESILQPCTQHPDELSADTSYVI